MFGFTRPMKDEGPKSIAKLNEAELKNVLEQERIVKDSVQVHMMLAATLQGTMRKLAEQYGLPTEFELNRTTGEIFEKAPPKDG